MDQTRNLKRSCDSPLHSPTAQRLNKRTKIIPDHEVITIKDGDDANNKEDTPEAPVHCLLDEEPDAAGFYHCIRLEQPPHVTSHPLPVKREILSPAPERSLVQTQPCVGNNEGNSNKLGSGTKHVNNTDQDNQKGPAQLPSVQNSDDRVEDIDELPSSQHSEIASTDESEDLFIQLPDETWIRLVDIELIARWVVGEDGALVVLE